MRRWVVLTLVLSPLSWIVAGMELVIDQKDDNAVQCSGMYSKSAWGGSVDPFILVKFTKTPTQDAERIVSLVIYEYKDKHLIGRPIETDPQNREWICDEGAIRNHLCNETQRNEFLLSPDAESKSTNPIFTAAINPESDSLQPINYAISRTGYYCVATWGEDGGNYRAVVEYRNAYGELPAAQIAKLPFYGGMTLVYAVIGVFWGFLYVQNRQDILPVQNYITAILVFLVIEMLLTWGFYDYQNVHGVNIGTRVYTIIVSILSAGRNSFSFFLLLIVCMGYGVVKPSLGKTMVYVRWLATAHFVFGVIYAIASLTIHPEDAGPVVLLVILPLSATLTAFYIWTLNSLNLTIKDLMQRKQHVKASMYKKLWYCILGSILVIFGFFFFNSFTFVGVGNEDFAPNHWQTRWFVLDGWLNLVYLADVAFVAYLWRPTANNRRFAMSDEIAQDDEGFEIASVRDSFDSSPDNDDVEGTAAGGYRKRSPAAAHTPPGSSSSADAPGPPAYSAGGSLSVGAARSAGRGYSPRPRDESPLPAPKPTKPASLPRESLDGETIFAVGDEDKWSDDDGEGEERVGMLGKRSD